MRPQNTLDWIAFVLLLIGAFSWGYFVTDVNILDELLEPFDVERQQVERKAEPARRQRGGG